jgi:hypothetical protein
LAPAAVLYLRKKQREPKQCRTLRRPSNFSNGFSCRPSPCRDNAGPPLPTDERNRDIQLHLRRPHGHRYHRGPRNLLSGPCPTPRTSRRRRQPGDREPAGRRGHRQAAGARVHRVRETDRRCRRGAVLGLPWHGAARREGAAASPLQAPVPRGVHRQVAVFAHDVPSLPDGR